VNNNFPNYIIDRTINNFLEKNVRKENMKKQSCSHEQIHSTGTAPSTNSSLEPSDNSNQENSSTITSNFETENEKHETETKIYFCNQMSNSYKIIEKELQKIIKYSVKPTVPNGNIKLLIYYKNKKLKNIFIKNNTNKTTEDFNVVYKYTCEEAPCKEAQSSYIGHTTTTIKERMKQHSSIKKHYKETHNRNITGSEMAQNVSILAKLNSKQELQILEALLIKQHRPFINIQTDDFNNTLKIF
jgi:hypothetical protein